MTDDKWVVVTEVSGELQADIIRSLLESQGIEVFLNQEGAGKAYGLSIGPLGEVQILVPEHQKEAANKIVDDYYAGNYEVDDELDSEEGETS
ncbi:MAG: putative signal transducing protein [Anaerolineales bacterium]